MNSFTEENYIKAIYHLSEDGKQRTILFFGGIGRAVAVLEDWDNDNRSFSWTNSSAPAPVSDYGARVSVIADGQTSVLKLTASYEAKGVSDAEAKKIIDQRKLSVLIEVDGGIKTDNIARVVQVGGEVIVSGSGIFKTPSYADTIRQMSVAVT